METKEGERREGPTHSQETDGLPRQLRTAKHESERQQRYFGSACDSLTDKVLGQAVRSPSDGTPLARLNQLSRLLSSPQTHLRNSEVHQDTVFSVIGTEGGGHTRASMQVRSATV